MADDTYKRKLTTIFSTDAVGYSRLMGDDEEATVRTIELYRKIISDLIAQSRGRVIDSPGDNLLAEFSSVVDAVQCAVAVQKELQSRNAELADNRKMEFRIGINLGDVIEEGDRIYGDGVNIAARLESLADPGGICISKTAFDHIETKLPLGYEYMGGQEVKNIASPVDTYRVIMDPRVTVARNLKKTPKVRNRNIIWGAVALLLIFAVIGIWQFYFKQPSVEPASEEKMAYPLPDKPSIAVLPFANLSDDPKQAYFSDGITENIIMALSKIPKMFVIARNSTFAYKDKSVNITKAAAQLGVRYILEGSVQKTGNRVRITAQLIDAKTGGHLWSDRYDRELKSIFTLQDEIALEIITALQVELTEGEQSRIHRGNTSNLEAFLKILKGREHHFKYTQEDMAIAKRLYREASALDPDYVAAYFWLAYAIDAEINLGWGKSREKSIESLLELANKIQAIDDASAQAHIILSRYYTFTGNLDRSIMEIKQAVEMDPNDADGYAFGGVAHNQVGLYKEAISWLNRAFRLNPSPPHWYLSQLGVAYIGTGSFQKALPLFEKVIQVSPGAGNHALYCHILSMLGRHEDALRAMEKAFLRQEDPNRQNMKRSHLAEYYRRTGLYQEAVDMSKALLNSNPMETHRIRAYITLACAYSAMDMRADAKSASKKILQIIPDCSLDSLVTWDSWMGLSFYDWFVRDEADKKLLYTALGKMGLE